MNWARIYLFFCVVQTLCCAKMWTIFEKLAFRTTGTHRRRPGHHQQWDEAGGKSIEKDGKMLRYLCHALEEVTGCCAAVFRHSGENKQFCVVSAVLVFYSCNHKWCAERQGRSWKKMRCGSRKMEMQIQPKTTKIGITGQTDMAGSSPSRWL